MTAAQHKITTLYINIEVQCHNDTAQLFIQAVMLDNNKVLYKKGNKIKNKNPVKVIT